MDSQLIIKKLGSLSQTASYALQNIKGSIGILETRRISKHDIDVMLEMLTVATNKIEVTQALVEELKRDTIE